MVSSTDLQGGLMMSRKSLTDTATLDLQRSLPIEVEQSSRGSHSPEQSMFRHPFGGFFGNW